MPRAVRRFPLGALLSVFRESHPVTGRPPRPRETAIHAARAEWLNDGFLDSASTADLAAALGEFYRAVVPIPWFDARLASRAGVIRHGLNHLLRGRDPLPMRVDRCASPAGAYYVPGFGGLFWSAVAKALDPDRLPDWNPVVRRGVRLAGLVDASANSSRDLAAACAAYDSLLTDHPDLSAADLDHFFTAVAGTHGRELGPPDAPAGVTEKAVADALRELRNELPLRRRSAEFSVALHAADDAVRTAVDAGRPTDAVTALLKIPGSSTGFTPDSAWVDTLPRLIEDLPDNVSIDERLAAVPEVPAAVGVRLVAAALHVRNPRQFPPWSDAIRHGATALDDGFDPSLPPAEQYSLLCELAAGLSDRFKVHPSEIGPLLERLTLRVNPAGDVDAPTNRTAAQHFDGFCSDTFRFLGQLADHNSTGWMAAQKERYRFVVRDPMVELCTALAERYVRPVLGGEYGWDLETDPRPGRALTSISKTDFGRADGPYVPVVRATFFRRRFGHQRADAQFFARLDPSGVTVGFQLGRAARDAGRRFRKNVQEHCDLVFAACRATGVLDAVRFGADAGDPATAAPIRTAADLRAWAGGKDLCAFRQFPADAAVLRRDEFVGDALILFDRLVPLFAAAVEDDPRPILARRAGGPDGRGGFTRDDFRAATGLGDVWLTRTLELLRLKKQLILQGVPGTGKTHVARALARLLTGDRAEAVRLVQFHPAYSYEEFVEGIRPKAVDVNGRSEVSYPVEPGLLAAFADRAARHPADPHVLIVDELNRGNLPRVFGELLFLLEYRDQEITLPYSKQPFRLPNNLYLIGTMNPADRSAVGVDQAVRRRFSFVTMPPDPAALARWFDAHPPADPDPQFGPRLVRWFEELNRRLARDLGADRQIGHSVLMVPDLTEDKLAAVWDHHVRPVLDDLFPGRPDRVEAFDPGRSIEGRGKRPAATR